MNTTNPRSYFEDHATPNDAKEGPFEDYAAPNDPVEGPFEDYATPNDRAPRWRQL